jgi:hypothetical protein
LSFSRIVALVAQPCPKTLGEKKVTPEEIFAGIGDENELFDISILVATAGKDSQSFSQRLSEVELNAILGSLMIRSQGRFTDMNYTIKSDNPTPYFRFSCDTATDFVDVFVHTERVSFPYDS